MAWYTQRYAALKGQNTQGATPSATPTANKTQPGQNTWWFDRYQTAKKAGLFDQVREQQKQFALDAVPKVTTQPTQVKVEKDLKSKVFDSLDRLKESAKIGADYFAGSLRNTTGMAAGWIANETKKNQAYYDEQAKLHPKIYGTEEFKNKRADQIKAIESFATTAKEFGGEAYKQGAEKQKKLDEKGKAQGFQWLAEQVLQSTPQFLASFGLGAATTLITKNPVAGVAVGFSGGYVQATGQAYQDARDFGVSDKKAEDVANIAGIASGIINVIPLGRVIERSPQGEAIKKAVLKEVVKSTIKQGALEASTNSLDQIVQNAIKTTYNENQALFEGVPESAIVGGFLGGVGGATVDLGIVGRDKNANEVIRKANEQIKEAVNTPKEQRTKLQQDIVDTFYTKELTPQQVTQMVMKNGLEDTEVGQTLMKNAAEAAQNKKNVSVVGSEDGEDIKIQVVDKKVFDIDEKSLQDGALKQSVDELATKAAKYDPEFKKNVEAVAKDLGVEFTHGPVKTSERMYEKIINDYKGDTKGLRDSNRSMFVIDDPSRLSEIESAVKKQFGNVERVKNKFEGEGYQSAIINVKNPDGSIAEIQVTTPEFLKARDQLGGHQLYEKVRIKAEDWETAQTEMDKLYSEARASLERRLKSSSEISTPSERALSGENSRPSDVKPKTSFESGSKSTETKMSSTSKKRGNLGVSDEAINSPPSKNSIAQDKQQGKQKETPSQEVKPQTPVGDGKQAASRLAERVNEQLGEQLEIQNVEYNKLNLEKDAQRAVDYLNENPDSAIRIAKGIEEPPEGQTANAIGVAAALKAQAEGKNKLAADLWTSVSLRSTRLGQEIVSLRGHMNNDSPQSYIKQVLAQRLNKLGANIMDEVRAMAGGAPTAKQKAMEKIDNQVKKAKEVLTREQKRIKLAQDIIEQLKCK